MLGSRVWLGWYWMKLEGSGGGGLIYAEVSKVYPIVQLNFYIYTSH